MFLCNSPSSYSNTSEDSPSLVFSEFNLANSSSSPFTFASIAEIALGSVEGSAFFFSRLDLAPSSFLVAVAIDCSISFSFCVLAGSAAAPVVDFFL